MELLKDRFFKVQSIIVLADAIIDFYPEFDKDGFLEAVFDEQWKSLELMDRMRYLATHLHAYLPIHYLKKLEILKGIAPKANNFDGIVLPELVARHGIEYWDESLEALRYLTRYSTSEFALRPYLLKDPDKVVEFLLDCAKDDNLHVRRWASEGCRPRLPWASPLPALKKDPSSIIPILELLKDDESEYVRRSVANNLNDISKDHPELVLEIARGWKGKTERTDKLIKHACRTLLKKGSTEVMRIFDFGDPGHVKVEKLQLKPSQLAIGEGLQFEFELENKSDEKSKLRLEYAIHFVKANGSTSKKVFQISEKLFESGRHKISRKHSFQQRTTRKHYPGIHVLEITVNGVLKATDSIDLVN